MAKVKKKLPSSTITEKGDLLLYQPTRECYVWGHFARLGELSAGKFACYLIVEVRPYSLHGLPSSDTIMFRAKKVFGNCNDEYFFPFDFEFFNRKADYVRDRPCYTLIKKPQHQKKTLS